MAVVYHEIYLPIDTESTFDYIVIKQGDAGTHRVKATLISNNRVYTIPTSGVSYYMKFRKPDNNYVLVQATVADNTISAEVTEEMLRVSGTGRGEFMIVSGSDELKTATFHVKIVKETFTSGDVQSHSDFAPFAALLQGAGSAASNANTAAAAANAAASLAEQKAEAIPDDYSDLVAEVAGKADQSNTYTKAQVDGLIEDVTVETDTTLTVSGAPADAAETGRQFGLLNESLGNTPYYKGYPTKADYPTLAHISRPGSYYILGSREYSDTPLGEEGREGILFVFRSGYSYATQIFFYNSGDDGSAYFRVVSRSDATDTDAWKPIGSNSNCVISWITGKKISIIGDSIDTFDREGYKIDGYNMYYPHGDVTKVGQTWWKQVLDQAEGILEVNASWSGSRVTDTASDSTFPDFYDRVSVIGDPDTIFITLGTNDSFGAVPLGEYDFESAIADLSEGEFRTAYIKGVKALKEAHPSATIVCIAEMMNQSYKDSIRHIANYYDAIFIDAGEYEGEGVDNALHPSSFGMIQIANAILHPIDRTLTQSNISVEGKAVGENAFTSDIKEALLEMLKSAVYTGDVGKDLESLSKLFFKPIKHSLKDSDFVKGKGFVFTQNATYPYVTNQSGRKSYINFDLKLEFGKTYRVKALVSPKYAATAQMMVALYDDAFLDAFKNQRATFNTASHMTGHGWTDLTDNIHIGYTSSYHKIVGIGISFRQDSNNSAISDDFLIKGVIVEEVDIKGKPIGNAQLYELTEDDFFPKIAMAFREVDYPYYVDANHTTSYLNYDVKIETGKTYSFTAEVNDKYASNAKMLVILYDQIMANAYSDKISSINALEHTNGLSWQGTTQVMKAGKTPSNNPCVGVLFEFRVDGYNNIPEDFVVKKVTIEEIDENRNLYTFGGVVYNKFDRLDICREVIYDTDWQEDVDDVVGMRVLSWGVSTNKIDLIGVVLDSVEDTSVSSLSKMMDYENLGNVEIGADKSATRTNRYPEKDYHQTVINEWNYGKYNSLPEVDDCVTFYRKKLSNAKGKVDIISVGFLNAISKLLDSAPDNTSLLNGVELVKDKVSTIWVMGGKYPTASTHEFNFGLDKMAKQAAHNFCEKCPVPIVFLGYEVGRDVYSGQTLAGEVGTEDLLYKVLNAYGVSETGRASWDPMTVLLAIRGSAVRAGYSEVRGTNTVDASTGINTFTPLDTGRDVYVVKRHPNAWYERELNQILERHSW